MKCLIVEDDKMSQQVLADLLNDSGEDVEITGYATTIKKAVEEIEKLKPDLVFLDIELPDGQGFQLFDQIGKANFETIFMTSNDAHAIRAFKFSAVDFLMKPINPVQLKDAIRRARKNKNELVTALKMRLLMDHFSDSELLLNKLALPISDGYCFVKPSDILYCIADGNYTTLKMLNKTKIVITRILGDFEDMLSTETFFRVHKSYLVNMRYISMYVKSEGGFIVMDNGDKLPLATRKKEAFMEKLKKV